MDLFEVHDIHTNTHTLSLQKPGAEELYVGFLDGVVVPKQSLELIRQMRLGIELKHNQADKDRYKEEHPHGAASTSTAAQLEGEQEFDEEVEEEGQGGEERPSSRKRKRTKGPDAKFKFTAKVRGQATIEVLAALALAKFPADLTFTDGHQWHILRLRGRRILLWEGLTTAQASSHFAESFKAVPPAEDFTVDDLEKEELRTPLEMLSRYRPAGAVAGMARQLANIAALGLDDATTLSYVLEGLVTHRQQAPAQDILGVPLHVRHMFS